MTKKISPAFLSFSRSLSLPIPLSLSRQCLCCAPAYAPFHFVAAGLEDIGLEKFAHNLLPFAISPKIRSCVHHHSNAPSHTSLHFLFIHVKRSRLTMLVWRLTNAPKMRMRASLRVGKETSSRGLDSMWTRQRRSVHLLLSGSYLNSKAFCSTGFPPPGCQRDSNQHLAHAQYLALVS